MDNIKKTVFSALFAALIFVATYTIKIPTPTMGYIHPGDGPVILAGLLLGPLWGGLAAGFGSTLSDVLSGYAIYVPATFVLKWIAAITAEWVYRQYLAVIGEKKGPMGLILSGTIAEAFVVAGYFLYDIALMVLLPGSGVSSMTISAAITAAATDIPFNTVQAIFGVIIAALLYHPIKKAISSF